MVQKLRDGILKSGQFFINKLLNWRKRQTLGMAKGCKLSSVVYERKGKVLLSTQTKALT
jgi:hypothetical protein